MKFTLEIELGNDAMQYLDVHVSTALRVIADSMERSQNSGRIPVPVYDSSGNRVGFWQVTKCTKEGD